jgi:tyrosyl-tRNA synthetase
MWRYYALLTDLGEGGLHAEQARGEPMASKMALARRIVGDFHGEEAAAQAEAEWRRVHQDRQLPSEMPILRLAPGPYRPHELLAAHGLVESRSQAVQLLRQGAVRKDGVVLRSGDEIRATPGASFVISIGRARYVRFEVGPLA